MPGEFSLGAALFPDFPVAAECAAPLQHAPDSWRQLFLTRYWGSSVFDSLFSLCRAGRDLVLREARTARVCFDLTVPPSDYFSRLAAAKQALLTRGEQGTELTLEVMDSPECMGALHALTGALHGVGSSVKILYISVNDDEEPLQLECTTVFLQQAAQVFPALTKIDISCTPAILPPCHQLPCLRTLTIGCSEGMNDDSEAVCRSVAPYIPQLTGLSINDVIGDEAQHSPLLFNPQSESHTLSELYTDVLSWQLLKLLVQHASTLTKISTFTFLTRGREDVVGGLSDRTWGVTELTCEGSNGFTGDDLAALPRVRQQGACLIHICEEIHLRAESAQGLSPVLQQRLPEFKLSCAGVCIKPHSDIPAEEQPAALRNTLRQLSSLQVAGSFVYLQEWHWTPQAMSLLSDMLPGLNHLAMGIWLSGPLTDELLSCCVRAAPYVRLLRAASLSLQSQQHSTASWPWRELRLQTLYISDVCKLPDPGEQIRRLEVAHMHINGPQIREVGLEPLLQRLRSVSLWALGCRSVTFLYSEGDAEAQVEVARALQWEPSMNFLADYLPVELVGWPMHASTMRALEKMPAWPNKTLKLTDCTWPLEPSEYRQLAACIPEVHQGWRVSPPLPPLVRDSLVEGYRLLGRPALEIIGVQVDDNDDE